MAVPNSSVSENAGQRGNRMQNAAVFLAVVFAAIFWFFKLRFIEGGRADVPMYELAVVLLLAIVVQGIGRILGKSVKIQKEFIPILYACLSLAIAVRGFLYPLLDIVGFTSMNVIGDSRYSIVKEAISPLLLVDDPNALIYLFIGGGTPIWSAWIIPLVMWGLILFAFIFLYFTLSSLFYTRWSERENLSFPLIGPVQVLATGTDNGTMCSFKNKTFVLGIVVAVLAVLFVEDGLDNPPFLNYHWPVIPAFSLNLPIHNLFPPDSVLATWLGGVWFRLNPLWTGFAFLSSTDFLFTFWVFFIVNKLSLVLISNVGGDWWTARQFTESQFLGGVFVVGLFMFWTNRGALVEVVRAALGNKNYNKEDFPMSPRLTVFGGAVALLFLIFAATYLMSIQFALFIPFLLAFILRAITLSRIRADAAIPLDYFLVPVGETVRHIFGDEAFQKASVVGMSFIDRHTTGDLFMGGMPRIVEAFKLSDNCSLKRSSMLRSLLVMVVIAMSVSSFVILTRFCQDGITFPYGTVNTGRVIDSTGFESEPKVFAFLAFGALCAAVMTSMRARYVWWPFHPWGYIAAWEQRYTTWLAGPFFIAWLVKVLGMRWFGGSFYSKAKPFFIGLIYGSVGTTLITRIVEILMFGA